MYSTRSEDRVGCVGEHDTGGADGKDHHQQRAEGINRRNREEGPRVGYAVETLHAEGAVGAFAKVVVLSKNFAKKAQEYLEQLYKPLHNNTLDGLDQVLAKARAELGISG